MKFLFHVKANDGRTDTSVVAATVKEVRALMAKNPWWKKYKLKPSVITKMGEVR